MTMLDPQASGCCNSAACPQSLVPISVFSVLACGLQMWAGLQNVLRSLLRRVELWAESVRPSLLRYFLGPQWPVCRQKMVWVLLFGVFIWSFCRSCSLHCFPVSRMISASVSEESWHLCKRWRDGFEKYLLLLMPVCPQFFFPSVLTCAGTQLYLVAWQDA